MADPKQHHYIPKIYLESFCDSAGVIWLHDKWSGRSFATRPKNALKENFYYAQPDHKNKTWNHNLERFFSKEVEADWPTTVRLVQNGPQNVADLHNLFMWMYSLRARVPNCRKAIEYSLQEQVKLTALAIKDREFLDREKKIVEHFNVALKKNYRCMADLYDDGAIVVTIDPHKSLIAMADIAKGFSRVVSELQLHFVKNGTSIDFNCSDNPIVYFPSLQSPETCTPYQFRPGEPFEFIFPITKNYCLYHNSHSPITAQTIAVTETNSVEFVERINRFVGAFADRYIVSSRQLDSTETPNINHCPRPRAYRIPQKGGIGLFLRYEMGEPLRLPKWQSKFETADEH